MQRTTTVRLFTIENQNVVTQALWATAFAILTGIGAQIEIPHHPVPYTLQTFFVLLAGAVLGKRNGAISMAMYLTAGIMGAPIFSNFGFGIAKIIGPTGGYLMSFPIAAFVVGYLLQQRSNIVWSFVSMFIGLFVIFSLGTLHLNLVYFHNWSESIASGFLIFSWWDGVKLIAAAAIANQLNKVPS
ncbi:MAG: biotin transporter BioY [Bacteroidota bacterium]|nr:biotin transporter BioY [Bacteroidota bacterium]